MSDVPGFLDELDASSLRLQALLGRPEIDRDELIADLQTTMEELAVASEEIAVQDAELQRLETGLEVERRRYWELFQEAPVAYLVTDADGKLLELNGAAERLLGFPAERLLGVPLAARVDPSHRRAFRQGVSAAARTGGAELPVVLHGAGGSRATMTALVRAGAGHPPQLRWLLLGPSESGVEAAVGPSGAEVARAVAGLTQLLAGGADAYEVLHATTDTAVELLGADACGALLYDHEGALRIGASSTRTMRDLELIQTEEEIGPCVEAMTTGRPLIEPDLRRCRDRWPDYVERALASGITSVLAVPIFAGERVLGALNVSRSTEPPVGAHLVPAARALASLAGASILQGRAVEDAEQLARQLQHALDSRVVIEQAKGIVAARAGIDLRSAFEAIRSYARGRQLRVRDVSQDIVDGRLQLPHSD